MRVNRRLKIISSFAIALLLLSSCSVQKFLAEDERLYTGAEINVETSDSVTNNQVSELKEVLEGKVTPKPNSSFLGLQPKLYFYLSTKEPKKDKGFKYWLKYKFGEAPVLMDDVRPDFTTDLLVNAAENKGYFNAKGDWDTILNDKKAKVVYNIQPKQPYKIQSLTYELDTTQLIGEEIMKLRDNSILKPNQRFDLSTIKDERDRIDGELKEKGFYYFNADNLLVQVDSTVGNHKLDLFLKLKDDAPEMAQQQYTIDNIIVYPNYSFSGLESQRNPVPAELDSVEIKEDIFLIDPENKFRNSLFKRSLYFKSGDVYNRKNHNLTLNRLINLGVFKFVKNQFYLTDSTNNVFDAYYLMTPQTMKSLQAEAKASTNSADFLGSELNVNWRHRNIFRGAELLKVEAFGAFNKQLSGDKDFIGKNLYRIGGRANLEVPKLVAPFNIPTSSEFLPKTKVELGYEYQNRSDLYSLNNFQTSLGYIWKEDARKEHELKLLDVTYVSPRNVSDLYREQASNNFNLQRVVDEQLIFGPTYKFTFTNTMLPKTHTFYYEGMLDLSANVTGLISGADVENGDQKEILGVPYSQYAKAQSDIRYYLQLNKTHAFATRLIAGIAYPYGNSEYVPFSKQFFTGGSNSNRGFDARTLGPGSYDPRNQNNQFLYDQAGDVKLEANIEYRPNLYKFLEGALFVDAGNVWLINENELLPGGKFSKDFLKEFAVSGGAGLRFDFSVVLLRLDLAMALRKPYLEEENRWTVKDIDLGDKDWRKDNLLLNIAIGYPF